MPLPPLADHRACQHAGRAFILAAALVACATSARGAVPDDPALDADRAWTRFLAAAFPEGIDPEESREPLTIREPGPDTANYPNSPNTLPRGGVYLEWSPVFFTSAITTVQPTSYNAEFLLRLGLTDRVEFRVYSSGYTWQAAGLGMGQTTGFSPLIFDTKVHFWEENLTGSCRPWDSRPSSRRHGDPRPSTPARSQRS